MLRRDYGAGRQRTASTGQECDFFKARDGNWYMGLSDYPPEDDEEMDYWEPDMTYYGPFQSFDEAHRFLGKFANPGGYTKDPSGRRPPPKVHPSRRYAKATRSSQHGDGAGKRIAARYLARQGNLD